MAAECRVPVFGDNSVAELRRISQFAPWNLAEFAVEKRWPSI